MTPRRRVILGVLLLASVALSWQSLTWSPGSFAPDGLAGVVQAVRPASAATLRHPAPTDAAAARAQREAPKRDVLLQLLARPEPAREPRDLFEAYSWAPPPPAAAGVAAAQAVPEAPPLPFVYAGRLEVEGTSIFLLLQGDRTRHVSIGESVDDFTLASSDPQGLVFLHRPTGLTRVLPAPALPVASN